MISKKISKKGTKNIKLCVVVKLCLFIIVLKLPLENTLLLKTREIQNSRQIPNHVTAAFFQFPQNVITEGPRLTRILGPEKKRVRRNRTV